MRAENGGAPKDSQVPPLDAFDELFTSLGSAAPHLQPLGGEAIPQPYRKLLVHDGDMTPALENHHRGTIHLELLRMRRHGDLFARDVVLRLDGSDKPVEFGAIEIQLDALPPEAQQAVIECRKPLGAILRDTNVKHLSRPKAYFSVAADALISKSFQLTSAVQLYGRRNTLLLPDGRTLANIVEILPP